MIFCTSFETFKTTNVSINLGLHIFNLLDENGTKYMDTCQLMSKLYSHTNFNSNYLWQVNVIPVIAKADTMTPEEVSHFKRQIMNQIVQAKIRIYEFPDDEALGKKI